MRASFKNFRRDYPRNDTTNTPVPKKRKIGSTPDNSNNDEAVADEDTQEYEEAIKQLQAEYAKGKMDGRNHSLIKELMNKTHAARQKWIKALRLLMWLKFFLL